jgi:deoxyribose-phosphate aldolase
MNQQELFSHIDYTLLQPGTTLRQIMAAAQEALSLQAASLCIAPAYVERVRQAFPDLRLTTVVGFPLGYNTPGAKVYEAAQAISHGADEIDAVVNLNDVKSGCLHRVRAELAALRTAAQDKTLKIILETCLLSWEEKRSLALLAQEAGADFVKTSTGFGSSGASRQDVVMLRSLLDAHLQIKAAGGIRTVEQMRNFLTAGASRIGSSVPLSKLLEQLQPTAEADADADAAAEAAAEAAADADAQTKLEAEA